MKILVIGSGGREHTIVHQLYMEGRHQLFCAPGNGGIAAEAVCVPIAAADVDALVAHCVQAQYDLVVVAPEDPLAKGLVDMLEQEGIKAFGPNAAAAIIEASKAFSKDLMRRYGIPTADYRMFSDAREALAYVESYDGPLVVKADGLALGKGVLICTDKWEAAAAVKTVMEERAFGDAGSQIVIEEFLAGPEVTLLCFCDGKTVKPMPAAQDHKRAFDGDLGPNTGGMGAFAPTPTFTKDLLEITMATIVHPTIAAMNQEGRPFMGVLYFGLMLTRDGVKVIEYNARFGDPESQAILPLLQTPLSDIFLAVIEQRLDGLDICWADGNCVCVVAASAGYPGAYKTSFAIEGIEAAQGRGAFVYHAGTALKEGIVVTNGGRVLGVSCQGGSMEEAIEKAYEAIDEISFEGMQYRRDIGIK